MESDANTRAVPPTTERLGANSKLDHVELRCSGSGSVGRLRTAMHEYVTPRTKSIHIELTGTSQPGYAELRQLREASLGLRCRGVVVIVESQDRIAHRMLELAGLTTSEV